jgi:hypothetical protein
MSNFFDIQTNMNFDLFKKVFAKVPPAVLAKCNLGPPLDSPATQKLVVSILKAYFEGRESRQTQIAKDLDLIFASNPLHVGLFNDLQGMEQAKRLEGPLVDLRVSTNFRLSMLNAPS